MLQEPVEFTGFFFKRMAYPAKYDTLVAPLILARSPEWSPEPIAAEVELPSVWAIAAAIVGAAIFGAAIAMFVYLRHQQTPSQRYGPVARVKPAQLAALRELPLGPSPSESMARMAEQAKASEEDRSGE